MIASLRGTLLHKAPTEVVVDVGGVGYGASIPLSTFEKLGEEGSPILLFTHLHVREDAFQIFGFATEEEREAFRMLISVSGIGPKVAQGILSGIAVKELRTHILQGDAAALTSIPGIGRKLAERLVVELRDKVEKIALSMPRTSLPRGKDDIRSQALMALVSLGYARPIAEKAIHIASRETNGATVTIEDLIKKALRHASKG